MLSTCISRLKVIVIGFFGEISVTSGPGENDVTDGIKRKKIPPRITSRRIPPRIMINLRFTGVL